MSFGRHLVTALGAACALWLSLATVGVIGPDTADRIGVLAPAWMLIPFVALTIGAAILLRAHGSSSFLWLPVVLLCLPWLPFVVPSACLLWVGTCAYTIWAALATAVVVRVRPRWRPPVARTSAVFLQEAFQRPGRAALVAGMLAAALYLFAGWQVSPLLPAGDEPHYLVIADSLLHDGDLRIENNHRAHQYLRYVDGELKPDFLRRGADGQIYSIHAPGLPALLLPAYAMFGYPAVVVFLALVCAAGSGLAWHLCFRLTGDAGAAWFGWATAALPAPALFHAFTIYPDGMGSVLVLTGAVALISADRLTVPRAGLHGAALAVLPWLHTRFVLLAVALGLCVVARLVARPARPRVMAAFLVAPLASAVAWFSYFLAIYGTPNPSAPYGTYTQSALSHVPAGLTGLLFDQQFGLIANAPVYLVGLCGLGWLMFRGAAIGGSGEGDAEAQGAVSDATQNVTQNAAQGASDGRRLAIELCCAIVPYTIAAAMYRMWWGGWSAPARFLTPVLPLLALPAALVWARARTQTTRASALVALVVSVWLSLVLLLVAHGRLAYNDRDGFALWTDWAHPTVDLASGLPSLFQTTWKSALLRATIWLGAIAATWAGLHAIERARRTPPTADSIPGPMAAGTVRAIERARRTQSRAKPIAAPIAAARAAPIASSIVAVSLGYAAAAMVAFTACWSLAGVSGLRPTASQVALLSAVYAGHRELALVYERGPWLLRPRIVPGLAVPARVRVESVTRRLPRERPLFFVPRLPAGRYQVLVTPNLTANGRADRIAETADSTADRTANEPGLEGRLDVFVGQSGTPLRSFDLAAAPPHELDLRLPIGVESLSIRADDRARRSVDRIALVPMIASDPRSGLPSPGGPADRSPADRWPADRWPGAVARQTIRYGHATVYAIGTTTFLEPGGFWIQPAAEANLLIDLSIAPGRPQTTTMTVLVRNGPVQNHVRLRVEGWQRELALPAGGETLVEVPVSRRGATPLRLYAAEGFRPSALDPANGDHRRLGVWVELREASPP